MNYPIPEINIFITTNGNTVYVNKVIFLIAIISLSLLAFQAQEAYAAAPASASAATVSTTTIRLCFNAADVDPATTANSDFKIDNVASVTNTLDEIEIAACGGVNDSVLLTVPEFATDATPTITVDAGLIADTPGGATNLAINQASTDGVSPTFDSASTVTDTTITATFSESLDADTVAVGDFTITNPSTSVLSVSVNGNVVTLTTSLFGANDTPNVAVTTVNDAAANTVANSNKDASDGVSLSTAAQIANKGASGSDTTAPSMGTSTRTGVNTIDNGFSYNFKPTNVNGWKNDYPLVRTPVGAMNTLDLKVMENKGLGNIYFVSVHFGAPQVGKQGEAIVTYYPNQVQKVKIDDPNNLLGEVDFTVNPAKCKANSTTESCFKFSLDHSFNEAPIHDVIGISIADISRNVGYAYFNHGVEVYGDSLNPAVTQTITDTYDKHTPQITLTQTDRAQDLWIDENENQWTRNIMGSWLKITQDEYILPDNNTVGSNGMKRINQHFAKYMDEQELVGKQIWDGSQIISENSDIIESTQFASDNSHFADSITLELEDAKLIWNSDTIQNDIPEYFAYDYPIQVLRSDNTQLQNAIDVESAKAFNFLNEYYHTALELDSSLVSDNTLEEFHNGALHTDYSKLQESKSLESDKALERLYKMYGKW